MAAVQREFLVTPQPANLKAALWHIHMAHCYKRIWPSTGYTSTKHEGSLDLNNRMIYVHPNIYTPRPLAPVYNCHTLASLSNIQDVYSGHTLNCRPTHMDSYIFYIGIGLIKTIIGAYFVRVKVPSHEILIIVWKGEWVSEWTINVEPFALQMIFLYSTLSAWANGEIDGDPSFYGTDACARVIPEEPAGTKWQMSNRWTLNCLTVDPIHRANVPCKTKLQSRQLHL